MDFIFFSQPQIFNKLKYIYASKYESEWYVVEMQNLKFFQCGQVLHFQQFQICNVKKTELYWCQQTYFTCIKTFFDGLL